MKKLFPTIVLLISLALPVSAQLTGKINMVGVPDRYKISNKGQSTTGLTNVGVGQRVVMTPVVFGRAGGINYDDTLVAVTSVIWTFTSKPAGSAVTLLDTSATTPSLYVYFIPDSIGTYVISMTATTSLGTALPGTITIKAGKFVGTGITVAATNGVPNSCACHQGILAQPFKDLLSTNHSQAVKRKLNDPAGHFGLSCMSCHSIGYDGVTTSNNSGFDDLAAGIDSTYKKWFPPIHPNGPGTFDSLAANNPNLMARAGIQCENCHGPASEHVKTGEVAKLDATLSSNVCQPCHYSSDRHGIGYQWASSAHATSTYEGSQLQYTDRFTCARCHTSQGYINEVIGGKPQPAVTGKLLVYPDPMPVGCTTCHDPHTNNTPVKDPVTGAFTYPQLRAQKIEQVCTGCHITRLSSRGGLHTSHQGSMLLGANATPMTLDKVEAYRLNSTIMENNVGIWGGWELPGYAYDNSSHSEIPELCVTCHMAKSPTYIANENSGFTIGDSLMTKLGRHTFMVAYDAPNGTTILNPTGCTECHGTVTIDYVDLTQAKTAALLSTLYTLLPKRDSAITLSSGYTNGTPISPVDITAWQNSPNTPASAKRKLTTVERAAAYNFIFVMNDKSGGVHNFNYTKELLSSSIEQLKLGVGTANIVQIKDVPNDNGGAVQVIWNQFPAEQFSFGRLTSYGIWRRDPILPITSLSINTITSFTHMLGIASVGEKYTMGGSVWTYVAAVPSSNLSMYSYVSPTMFDSTKTGGVKYSAFYIAGYSSDGSALYQSPIDSGYSTNNLVPSAVVGVTGSSSTKGVKLAWQRSTDPRDNDLAQYLVFRSTTSGFTPNPASPYAAVNDAAYLDSVVTTGTTYYYRIGAVDKAGNAGPYSDQFSLTVTSVEQLTGTPTSFALDQNYPNPFNPSTQIRFALPNQAKVHLAIYSVSGELVRTLVNGDMAAGFFEVPWNGMNDHGQSVSSGVYLFRVQAGNFVSAKKMLLVK
jgi:hypothetical protein